MDTQYEINDLLYGCREDEDPTVFVSALGLHLVITYTKNAVEAVHC